MTAHARVGDWERDQRRGRVYVADIAWPLGRMPGWTAELHDNFHRVRQEGGRPHPGMDIGAPMGTPVRAPLTARVERSSRTEGRHREMGHFVWLRDPRGYLLKLMHFRDAPTLAAGDMSTRGAVFAHVGQTGNTLGPHLHFGVLDAEGHEVNAYPALYRAYELEHVDEPAAVNGARGVGAWEVGPFTGRWWFGNDLPGAFVWGGARFERSTGTERVPGTRAHYREQRATASRHLYVLEDGTYRIDHVDAYNPNAGLCAALKHYWWDVRPSSMDPVVSGVRRRDRVGDAAADERFAQSMALANNWARHFRVPREWWDGDPMRIAIARQIRERIEREVPRITRHAVELRAAGDIAHSDEIAARLVAYVDRTQSLFPRMLDNAPPSLLGSISSGISDLAEWAMGLVADAGEGLARGAQHAAEGAASALSGLVLPVVLIAGGIYVATHSGGHS